MPDSHEMDHPAKPFFALFVAVDDSSAQNPNPSSKPPTPRSFGDGSVGLGIVAADDSPAQNPNPSPKPPTSRSFDDGSVGLGIIAAMIGAGPPRSGPIPIVSARPAALWRRSIEELSEGYTTGGMPVRKRVYLGGGGGGGDRRSVASFLSCCYLCRKDLNGLDIFMYRGDRAFCSVECRSQVILSDEYMEKCGAEAMKPPFDFSSSPPLLFAS